MVILVNIFLSQYLPIKIIGNYTKKSFSNHRQQTFFNYNSLMFVHQITCLFKYNNCISIIFESWFYLTLQLRDSSYKWNEWEMRAEALELSDLRKKKTRAAQTDLRFCQREAETQVQIFVELFLAFEARPRLIWDWAFLDVAL